MVKSKTMRPIRRADAISFPLDDELVLTDAQSGQTYTLNATGARIWSLCDGTRTEAALARAIAVTYGIEYDLARSDVSNLLTSLREAGLLVAE